LKNVYRHRGPTGHTKRSATFKLRAFTQATESTFRGEHTIVPNICQRATRKSPHRSWDTFVTDGYFWAYSGVVGQLTHGPRFQPLKCRLGTLKVRYGLFPFWPVTLAPRVWLPTKYSAVFAVLKYNLRALPPHLLLLTHYLNNFRRKPAITEFDKPFTPSLQSSLYFATY